MAAYNLLLVIGVIGFFIGRVSKSKPVRITMLLIAAACFIIRALVNLKSLYG